MTGSGTQADPYIIKTVYDLCAVQPGTSDNYKYYKLGNDIDFNDHDVYKNGITASGVQFLIKGQFANLDGDGKAIRNIVVTGFPSISQGSIMYFNKIYNVRFENIVLKATSNSEIGVFRTDDKIENCSFYTALMPSYPRCLFATTAKLLKCSLTFSGSVPSNINMNAFNMDSCHIHFADLNVQSITSESYQPSAGGYTYYNKVLIFISGTFKTCYFTGNINQIGGEYYPQSTGSGSYASKEYCLFARSTFDSCYIAIGYSSYADPADFIKRPIYFTRYGTTVNSQTGINFIDRNKFFDNFEVYSTLSGSTSCRFLTTEQCKDQAYLASIGFPVLSVEE